MQEKLAVISQDPKTPLDVSTAATEWLSSLAAPGSATAESYLRELNIMRTLYGDAVCTIELPQSDVRRIYSELRDRYSTNRANHLFAAMSSYWKWAQRQGRAERNPFSTESVKRRPNEDHIEERILERDEVRLLVDSGRTEQDQLMMRFLYLTWLRVDGAANATWRRVSTRQGAHLLTATEKGGKTRTITLPETLFRDLLEWMPRPGTEGPEAKLLRQRNGKPYSVRQIQRVVESAAKRAGAPFFINGQWIRRPSPHWFRHAGATHALEDGMPVNAVQQRLGHSSLATTSRYTKVTAEVAMASYITDPWAVE